MEDYKTYRLGDIAEMRYGKLPPESILEGKYPVYSGYRVVGFTNTFNCKKGSIIVIARGVGGTGDVKLIKEDCFLTNLSISVVLDPAICNSAYFYYKYKMCNLRYLDSGSAQSQITIEDLKRLELKLPPISKQLRVVSVLQTLDNKIDLNKRINHNLEQQAQAIFKSWFVDFEPYKDCEFVDSAFGLIPKGWKNGALSDISTITMGQSPSGASFNENGDGLLFYQGRTEFGFRYPTIKLFTTEPTRYAEANSILMSVRAPVGDINIATSKCCIGRGLASIKSKDKAFSFLLYTLKNKETELDLYNGEGTVFGSINRKELEQLPIIVPPLDVIDSFNRIVYPLDKEIEKNCREVMILQETRDYLLPSLMTGRIITQHQ